LETAPAICRQVGGGQQPALRSRPSIHLKQSMLRIRSMGGTRSGSDLLGQTSYKSISEINQNRHILRNI
jgi:hypothetical protein